MAEAGHLGPRPPRLVGRYEIIREIGRGGMAIVYVARQPDLDRQVALKELSRFHAGSPEFAHRFLRESRMAASLNHPNIVTVHEYFEHEGTPYIAMEYVPRGALRPYIKGLSLAQIAGVVEGILAGLAYAETAGIVHRDLKPENLMVTADGRVKITDFGIARATQRVGTQFMTAPGMTVGTPTYMAPEQAMGGDIGPWTDLYSAGIIAYELVVGHAPFHDTEAPMVILMRHVNERIPPPIETRPDIDPRLSRWIDSLLAKDPRERVRHAAVAWESFEEIVVHQLGPLWRRDARLLEGPVAVHEARPLTPAPFESQGEIRTPPPESSPVVEAPPAAAAPMVDAAPVADQFVTFDPHRSPVPGSPPAPASPPAPVPVAEPGVEGTGPSAADDVTTPEALSEPARGIAPVSAPDPATTATDEPDETSTVAEPPAPGGEAGFVTFNVPGAFPRSPPPPPRPEVGARADQDASDSPLRTPEPPPPAIEEPERSPGAGGVDGGDVTIAPEALPAPDALTGPSAETQPEPAAEPEAEGDAAPLAPGAAEPEAQSFAEPESVAEPELAGGPELVAEPEPLAEPGSLEPSFPSGLVDASTPESVAKVKPPAPPEQEPDHSARPAPVREAPPIPSEPTPAVGDRGAGIRQRRPAGRTAIGVIGAVVAIVAAGVGFAIAPGSGGTANRPPRLAQRASAGPLTISFPSGWQRSGSTPASARKLELTPVATLLPGASAPGGALVVGTSTSQNAMLVSTGFVSTLSGSPSGATVRLGQHVFKRYLDLLPAGASTTETVYALPTTAGIATAVCIAPQTNPTQFAATCERAISTLTTTAALLPLGADPAYAKGLSDVVRNLNSVAAAAGHKMSAAKSQRGQAAAAHNLGAAYGRAADAAAKLTPSPASSAEATAITAALRQLARAYSALGDAAAHNDARAYSAARGTIGKGQTALTDAFAQLEHDGYTVH